MVYTGNLALQLINGVIMMVSKRSGLLGYLRNTDRSRYIAIITKLGLRK